MDEDAIRTIAEDLEYLGTWIHKSLSDAETRRGSAVLRRLLVEDAYGGAWRALGFQKQPSLNAVNLKSRLWRGHHAEVDMALALGARRPGLMIGSVVKWSGGAFAMGPDARPPPSDYAGQSKYPGEERFMLSDFLSSWSGVVKGRAFSRRDVIKYIANVKGGVHLSAKERKAEEKLVDRLGKIDKRLIAAGQEGLLLETLAIGQAVGRSDDAKALIVAAHQRS